MPDNKAPAILVIDAELASLGWLRDLVENVFADGGYRLLATGSNDEALSIIEADPSRIQLIVHDCSRPLGACLGGDSSKDDAQSGIRFYEDILRPRFPHLPVIFLPALLDLCLERNGDAQVLAKPFEMLLDAMRKCLAKSQHLLSQDCARCRSPSQFLITAINSSLTAITFFL